MPKKKRPLGFQTPSMRIEEEYEEIIKQLKKKKADWKVILKECYENFEYAADGVKEYSQRMESKEAARTNLMELEHRIMVREEFMTQIIISRIGLELAECDARISDIEKELKTLRRGLS